MNETAWMVSFVTAVGLLFLFSGPGCQSWPTSYHYLMWHRTRTVTRTPAALNDNAVVLIETTANIRSARGVEHQERTQCPRKAQRILSRRVHNEKQRGFLYRDGAHWVILTGPNLEVAAAPENTMGTDTDVRTIHYVRQGSPDLSHDAKDVDPTTAGNHGASSVKKSAIDLTTMVRFSNSAIHPGALLPNSIPVQRYRDLSSATVRHPPWITWWAVCKALRSDLAPTELRYLLTNGQNDPSFYVIRTDRAYENPIISAPSLPGTLYRYDP